MDFYKELIRIAKTLNEEDAAILYSAALKLLDPPEPKFSKTEQVKNYGYHIIKAY